jgi:F-type H+-transporting ATPase subunit epsilon
MEGAEQMTPFSLKIVTPDGLAYEGQAEEVTVRSTTGDIGILAGHLNCVAPLGMGRATIVIDGQKRYAACIGGMLSVVNGAVTLVPTTFEWADKIDTERAENSYQRAQAILQDKNSSDTDLKLAEARLRRALVRKNVASLR